MKRIPLTQGKFALVDDEDYDFLMQWKWSYSHGYAYRCPWDKEKGRQFYLSMHRLVAKTPEGMKTDHKNGNRLDNRKINLRICESHENSRNQGLSSRSKTGFKGVRFRRNKWVAEMFFNKKHRHLGTFDNPVEAAKAYDVAARLFYGEFARTNFNT